MKIKKRKVVFIAFTSVILFVLFANIFIEISTRGKVFSDTDKIEKNKVGLVLGTAKLLKNGNINLYFKYRIDATVKLYQAGKIEFVLVSGDNGNKEYDEPTDFKEELVRRGIPARKIYLDYAGFRTLDSVVRAKKIFGQDKLTFISQQFHNERAVFLAQRKGIDAIGFNARDVSGRYGLKVKIREYLARTKAFIDIVLRVKPKFLGDKVIIK